MSRKSGGLVSLMVGPPGTGKSMLAKRMPTILPEMTEREAMETTRIHSIAGQLAAGSGCSEAGLFGVRITRSRMQDC